MGPSLNIATVESPRASADFNANVSFSRARSKVGSTPEVPFAAVGASTDKASVSSTDQLLTVYGPKNVYLLFLWLGMASVWGWTAMPMMVSAMLMESSCVNGSSNSNSTLSVDCAPRNGTMAKEFELGTEGRENLGTYATSAYLLGDVLGSVFLPALSDKTGRWPLLFTGMAAYGIFGMAAAAAPNIYAFIVLRFLQGSQFTSTAVMSWTLAYESIPPRLRSYTTLSFGLCWVAGYCVVAPMAYAIQNWRWLVFAVSVPSLLNGIFIYFTIPESFHYLVSRGRCAEVTKWIERANRFATWTNSPRTDAASANELCGALKRADDADDALADKRITKKNLIQHLLTNRTLFGYLLMMMYLWTCDAFLYYGLSLFSANLAGGNEYLNLVLMGLVEIPSYLVSPFFLDKLGRRYFMSLLHFLAAISFFAALLWHHPGMHLAMWLVAKFAVSCAFTSLFVYSSELFPTIVRNGCLGVCSVVARLGASCAPTVNLLANVSPLAPTLFFGVCALVGGALTLLLPETRNRELPDSPDDKF